MHDNPTRAYDSNAQNAVWAARGGWAFGRVAVTPAINAVVSATTNSRTLGVLIWAIANKSADTERSSDTSTSEKTDQEGCPPDCEALAKQARGQAKRVQEHVSSDHFHSKPCINLSQTLAKAQARPCNMADPRFQFAIGVFNAVCTDPGRFPSPYAKPDGPPYDPF